MKEITFKVWHFIVYTDGKQLQVASSFRKTYLNKEIPFIAVHFM